MTEMKFIFASSCKTLDKEARLRNKKKKESKHITLQEQFTSQIVKYHTAGTIHKSNSKIVSRGNIDTPNTQMNDRFFS